MTREEREIIEAIKIMGYDRTDYPREKVSAVISMAIEALLERDCVKCKYYYEVETKHGIEECCLQDEALRMEERIEERINDNADYSIE